MTTPAEHTPQSHPTRLRWKGLDVSDEFRNYAERVARGEDLPPFEGRVLAEPNPAFPWGPGTPVALRSNREGRASAGRTALWASAVAVLGLLAWSMALRVEASNVEDAALTSASGEESLVLQGSAPLRAAPQAVAVEPQQEPIPALPPDVVDVPVSPAPAVAAGEAPVLDAHKAVTPDPAPAASAVTAVATAPSAAAAVVEPAVVASTPLAASVAPPPQGAVVAAPAAPNPALVASKTAIGAPLPARAAGDAERTAAAAPKVDEFGILVDSPSSFAPQAPAAKTNAGVGSVGDLARAGQGSGASVRKEPGGESSAKGSLLVENPSF